MTINMDEYNSSPAYICQTYRGTIYLSSSRYLLVVRGTQQLGCTDDTGLYTLSALFLLPLILLYGTLVRSNNELYVYDQ